VVLRRLLLGFNIGISFDGGFLPGLKNLIEVTIATQNQKLKYMLILCVPICLIYYFVQSTHPKEAKPHMIKTRFSDVKGIDDDTNTQLEEIVDHLRHHKV
jgi:ATP-dependent Zn protease